VTSAACFYRGALFTAARRIRLSLDALAGPSPPNDTAPSRGWGTGRSHYRCISVNVAPCFYPPFYPVPHKVKGARARSRAQDRGALPHTLPALGPKRGKAFLRAQGHRCAQGPVADGTARVRRTSVLRSKTSAQLWLCQNGAIKGVPGRAKGPFGECKGARSWGSAPHPARFLRKSGGKRQNLRFCPLRA